MHNSEVISESTKLAAIKSFGWEEFGFPGQIRHHQDPYYDPRRIQIF